MYNIYSNNFFVKYTSLEKFENFKKERKEKVKSMILIHYNKTLSHILGPTYDIMK